jgi:hypothetical protein
MGGKLEGKPKNDAFSYNIPSFQRVAAKGLGGGQEADQPKSENRKVKGCKSRRQGDPFALTFAVCLLGFRFR